jgi:plastocyanin
MKKISTLIISALMIIFCSYQTNAALIIIDVEDDEFSPEIFTVNVGDQIMWSWDDGYHTTTSTNIPSGAATWNEPIDPGNLSYTYTVTVPGSYDYVCLIHQSMGMVGHFTALGSTGMVEIPSVPVLFVNGNAVSNGELMIGYALPETSKLSLRIYDILGKSVRTFLSADKPAGVYNETLMVADLKKGIYMLELETSDARITRKIVIQ